MAHENWNFEKWRIKEDEKMSRPTDMPARNFEMKTHPDTQIVEWSKNAQGLQFAIQNQMRSISQTKFAICHRYHRKFMFAIANKEQTGYAKPILTHTANLPIPAAYWLILN